MTDTAIVTTAQPREAQGDVRTMHTKRFQPPASQSLSYVSTAINNPYLREQIINLMPQIFTGRPDVTVCKIGKVEPDPKLTDELTRLFKQTKAYRSMQISYLETLYYGASIKSVGWINQPGHSEINEIRDLPASTFGTALMSSGAISPNPLMPGISVKRGDDHPIVAQTDPTNLRTTELHNFTIIRRPDAPYPAGEAFCMPIYPVIYEIDKVTDALNRKVERIGQPLVFPQITDQCSLSIEEINGWTDEFFKTWGSAAGFMLPQGIELAEVRIYESQGGEERLAALNDLIAKYFNPTTTLDKDGQNVLSTSESGKTAIWHAYITSQQEWIEEEYERIFGLYLYVNGYSDDYEINITIPRPAVDNSQIKLQQLTLALQNNLVTKAEARDLMNTLDLPPLTPEIEAELTKHQPAPQAFLPPAANRFGAGDNRREPPDDDETDELTNVDDAIDAFADAVVGGVEVPDAVDLPAVTHSESPKRAKGQLEADSRPLEEGMWDISEQVREALAKILSGGA